MVPAATIELPEPVSVEPTVIRRPSLDGSAVKPLPEQAASGSGAGQEHKEEGKEEKKEEQKAEEKGDGVEKKSSGDDRKRQPVEEEPKEDDAGNGGGGAVRESPISGRVRGRKWRRLVAAAAARPPR